MSAGKCIYCGETPEYHQFAGGCKPDSASREEENAMAHLSAKFGGFNMPIDDDQSALEAAAEEYDRHTAGNDCTRAFIAGAKWREGK